MTLSKRRAMFYYILSQIFIVKSFTKSLLIQNINNNNYNNKHLIILSTSFVHHCFST